MKIISAFFAILIVTFLAGCAQSSDLASVTGRTLGQGRVAQLVVAEARSQGVPQQLALSVAYTESRFNHRARSRSGAMGVMQIMPGTWRAQRCSGSPWIAEHNVRCGVGYLAQGYREGGARWAAARYHGGPRRASHGRSTNAYVEKVMTRSRIAALGD